MGRACKLADLHRIRRNLRTGYAGTSASDADYLAAHGEIADIDLLVGAETSFLGAPDLGFSGYDEFRRRVARSVIRMSRTLSASALFSIAFSSSIMVHVVALCANARFANISSDVLLDLLDNESLDVRRAVSIKTVSALSKERIKSTLDQYLRRDKFRYYNVIHWLDLGASMSRRDAGTVTRAALLRG